MTSKQDYSKPLSPAQLQSVLASVDTDLSVTEQIVAGLQNQINELLPALRQAAVPVGSIFCFGGPTTPPDFYLCDGTAFSKVDFPDLFAAIGHTHTRPEFATGQYFNIPDLRGMFVRGHDYDRGLDPEPGGRLLGSAASFKTAMPTLPFGTSQAGKHGHTTFFWSAPLSGAGSSAFLAASPLGNSYNLPTSSAGEHSHDIVGGDAETCPVNVALNYIIKIK